MEEGKENKWKKTVILKLSLFIQKVKAVFRIHRFWNHQGSQLIFHLISYQLRYLLNHLFDLMPKNAIKAARCRASFFVIQPGWFNFHLFNAHTGHKHDLPQGESLRQQLVLHKDEAPAEPKCVRLLRGSHYTASFSTPVRFPVKGSSLQVELIESKCLLFLLPIPNHCPQNTFPISTQSNSGAAEFGWGGFIATHWTHE